MKRQYTKPVVKYVDFQYDEQVAASSKCVQYNHWSHEYPSPTLCTDMLQDIKVRTFSACIEIASEA